jgi:hypothetical protein
MNHYPVYGSRPPAFCSTSATDTADPEQPIDCPLCRMKLEEMVAAYTNVSKAYRNTNPLHEHNYRAKALKLEACL